MTNVDTVRVKSETTQIQSNLDNVISTPEYKKIDVAKLVYTGVLQTSWYENVSSLIKIVNNIRKIDKDLGGLQVEDFKIDLQKLSMKGSVGSIAVAYKTGGLIDNFSGLDFIDYMKIPFFQTEDGKYSFTLEANLKTNDAGTNNSK